MSNKKIASLVDCFLSISDGENYLDIFFANAFFLRKLCKDFQKFSSTPISLEEHLESINKLFMSFDDDDLESHDNILDKFVEKSKKETN